MTRWRRTSEPSGLDGGPGQPASDGRASPPPGSGRRHMRRTIWLALLALVASLSSCTGRQAAATPAWLVERARQEAELAARSPVVHDFRFTDRRQASRITFENRTVDAAGRAYPLGHYDHGKGLFAADLDRGRLPD